MSEHTKKHPIKAHSHGESLIIIYHQKTYAIPKGVANKYIIEDKKTDKSKKMDMSSHSLKTMLTKLDVKFTKAGALLKGLRLREDLSQVEFSKKIKVTQANLSSMENGHRPIGKIVAKRIEKVFGTNYRYFLE